ncbi:MAG TPA: protein tyrosine phosphatase family protein [Novosphingobium sp.]|nr:protein tyrosine phosphatase family protein [Novosphingobium sp.]
MADPEDIACWQRLDARITTSGRLNAADPQRLAAAGVGRVINLALADSPGALADEAALVAASGMDYRHIPVRFDAPQEADYAAFVAALEEDEAPVHVHCIMNWRVSAFFYRYNRARGMAGAEARALMERQWRPEDSEHPVWADFIRREDS